MAQPTPTPQRKREVLTARSTTDRGGRSGREAGGLGRAAGGGRRAAGGGRRVAVVVWRALVEWIFGDVEDNSKLERQSRCTEKSFC